MNPELEQMAASAICHAAEMAQRRITDAAEEYARPSVLFRPAIAIDGNQWCVLYGANLIDGVAGFGDSPELAMRDFDKNWYAKLAPKDKP